MKIIYAFILIFCQACTSKAQTFEGDWKGELVIQGQRLPLLFYLVKDTNAWGGYMQSPAQGTMKIPLSMVSVRGDSLQIEVKSIGLKYSGVRADSIITGVFSQSGIEVKMNLERSGGQKKENTVAQRSQIVLPPYPYDTLAVNIKNNYDHINLAGTLTFPKKPGKYPAVLLLTGSGPQNRDEELFGHQPFRVLADYLTKNGIVVLRVDDRGVGESGGDFTTSTIENFSKDAISSLAFLRKQKQVDTTKVGIIGHSEGGLIALLLAGQHLRGLDFIVSLAGPAYAIDQLMVDQLYSVGKAAGMGEKDLQKAKAINARNFAIVKGRLNVNDAYRELVRNMQSSGVNEHSKEMERELFSMLTPAYRYFMRIEPESYISNINIPVFAAFGSLDVQVPAEKNLKSLQDTLPTNSKTILKEYSGLNHLFQQAKTGAVVEYAEIDETMNPLVLKDIVKFIKNL